MKNNEIFERMNELGAQRIPFLFLIDFKKENGNVIPLSELNDTIHYQIDSIPIHSDITFHLKKNPISFARYKKQFKEVQHSFQSGETTLINLTCATPIEIDLTLEEIYTNSNAKYKVFKKDDFVCFSPETFVKMKKGKIYSYPMKGTIDASLENAKDKILSNPKELAEHTATVELIKKDLEKVSKDISIPKFRYVEEVKTHEGTLLQVSSEVSGVLPADFQNNLGDIFDALLPAGSICGSPKEASYNLIQTVEKYPRNYYTGIFGVFDGENVDSAVLIRFIEKTKEGLVFKSGGGVTAKSKAEWEYNEMIEKVYVPIH